VKPTEDWGPVADAKEAAEEVLADIDVTPVSIASPISYAAPPHSGIVQTRPVPKANRS
jgi:hypothetical protein